MSDSSASTYAAHSVPHPCEAGRCCPVCGGVDFRLLHQWETSHLRNPATIPLGIWQCACGIGLLHPLPSPDQLPDSGDWWTNSRKRIYRNHELKKLRVVITDRLFGTAKGRLIRQTRRACPGGKLLDIGCGAGSLMQEAQPFFSCVGIEPSPRAAAIARSLGFEVIQSTFEEAQIEPETFDVVTMDAVLEHVVDPVTVLRKIARSLRVGGVVAVKVPKLEGPSHRRHGREWNGFRVGYHTVMFTGKTLAAAFEAAGLQPLRRPSRDRLLDDILIRWARKTSAAAGREDAAAVRAAG